MYINVDGQNVYYQKLGTGPDLIMLHGWGNDVSSFWQVSQDLKDAFTLYLIDLPGFGRSDLPKKPFTVSDYVKVIEGFITQLKLKKPNLLGHSVGGRIAIKLASQKPELISKLILEDAAGIKPKRDASKFIFYILAKILKNLIPDLFNLREQARIRFYKSLEADYINAGGMKETLKNILDEDLTSYLPKINSDTLLLWGEKDPTQEASLKNGKKMYKLIRDSRIEVFEGVGHFPHLEKPQYFTHYVKDFI